MARKSMTLLQNKDNILPLKRGGLTVAVMGVGTAYIARFNFDTEKGEQIVLSTALSGVSMDCLLYTSRCV